MIPFTTSNFLNVLLDKTDCNNFNLHTVVKDYKDEVKTEIDKWFWNQIVGVYSPMEKMDCKFNPADYQEKVFNKYVSSSGRSSTDYGEFIRAFNKLAYRWFNDGDEPCFGPYSALTIFMNTAYGSRKFKFDYDSFELYGHSKKLFGDNYDIEDKYAQKFNYLIEEVTKCYHLYEMVTKHNHPDAMKWCNAFITIIDQLDDDIKGMDKCEKSCDDYYKNILEFEYPEIYKWLNENLNIYNLGNMHCETFSDSDETFEVTINNSVEFSIRFFICLLSNYEFTKDITVNISNSDPTTIALLKKLKEISTECHSKTKTRTKFLTLKEYMDCRSNLDLDSRLIKIDDKGKITLE